MPPLLLGDVAGSGGLTRQTLLPLRARVFTDGTNRLLLDLCASRKGVAPLDAVALDVAAGDALADALRSGKPFDLAGERAVTWDPARGRLSVHRHYLTLNPAQARKLARLVDRAAHPTRRRRKTRSPKP